MTEIPLAAGMLRLCPLGAPSVTAGRGEGGLRCLSGVHCTRSNPSRRVWRQSEEEEEGGRKAHLDVPAQLHCRTHSVKGSSKIHHMDVAFGCGTGVN